MISIYTDGSCYPNPGPGGYAAIVIYENGIEHKMFGGVSNTTNNRMELMAVAVGLKYIGYYPEDVTVFTDSKYVIDGIQYMRNWIKNDWKTTTGSPVKNQDLWVEIKHAIGLLKVRWRWIKGHDGHKYNEMADFLSKKARMDIS